MYNLIFYSFENGESTSYWNWLGHNLFVCGCVPTWKGGNHCQWPRKQDNTQLRSFHRYRKIDWRCSKEPSAMNPNNTIFGMYKPKHLCDINIGSSVSLEIKLSAATSLPSLGTNWSWNAVKLLCETHVGTDFRNNV